MDGYLGENGLQAATLVYPEYSKFAIWYLLIKRLSIR